MTDQAVYSTLQVPQVTDGEIASLSAEIESVGFGCVPNYIDPEQLTRMQGFVHAAVERSGREYVGFGGPGETAGSGLDELYHSPEFGSLMKRLYERGTGRSAPNQAFYHVLRCLSGQSGQKHSLIFHYDSYVVTALIPIVIPSEGQAGDLLMFPNRRGIRPAYVFNALDKVLLDNPLNQRRLRRLVQRSPAKATRVKMKPGNLYFFWGYRSIHANEPCDPDKVRATALYHYANPHAN